MQERPHVLGWESGEMGFCSKYYRCARHHLSVTQAADGMPQAVSPPDLSVLDITVPCPEMYITG